jgi:predicted RNase H-like HicB family nuclease
VKQRRPKNPPKFLLPITIELVGASRYLGRCSSLPGFLVEADSVEEVVKLAPRIARSLVRSMMDKGVALPRALRVPESPRRMRLLVAA